MMIGGRRRTKEEKEKEEAEEEAGWRQNNKNPTRQCGEKTRLIHRLADSPEIVGECSLRGSDPMRVTYVQLCQAHNTLRI